MQVLPYKDFGGPPPPTYQSFSKLPPRQFFFLATDFGCRPHGRDRRSERGYGISPHPLPENPFSFQTEAWAPSGRRGPPPRLPRPAAGAARARRALRPPPPRCRRRCGGRGPRSAPLRPRRCAPGTAGTAAAGRRGRQRLGRLSRLFFFFYIFFGFRAFFIIIIIIFYCDLLFFPSGPVAPCHEQPEGSMKAGRRGYPARSGVGWLLAKCCCCCSCKGRWGPPGCGERSPAGRGAGAGAGEGGPGAQPCPRWGSIPPPPARSASGGAEGRGR